MPASIKPGVVTGQALMDLLQYAKDTGFAIPAVNAVSSSGINACLEAAAKFGGPMIVQFSRGGGQFMAGTRKRSRSYFTDARGKSASRE